MKANKKKVDYKKIILTWLKSNYIYLIMIALVGARVVLGYLIGAWYGTDQGCDDLAMFNGLNPERLIHPDENSLIKDLSFSLFLGLSAVSGLPYVIFLSIFWALVAFVMWILVGKVTKNKWVKLFAFVYVLFLPTAFENWGGLRIYRNSIFAPCIILTFSFALILLIDLIRREKTKKTIIVAILAGLSFAFTAYLQEDAAWLKLCMLVLLLISIVIIAYRFFKKKKKIDGNKNLFSWLLICSIPFLVLFSWGNIYKGFNHFVFGVYETNTRTNGELAKYVETTYVVDSPNRTRLRWSPYDAIVKTFEASPTLGSHPELLEEIRTTVWAGGDLENVLLPREFFGWAIRTELKDAGLWTSEADVSNMFKQVNKELEEAFKNGSLKKAEGRIQPIKSAYPYTLEEIIESNFPEQILQSLKNTIWFDGYTIGYDNSDNNFNVLRDGKILHMIGDVNTPNTTNRKIGNSIATAILWIYRVINTILILILVTFVFAQIVGFCRNWRIKKKYIKQNKLYICLAVTSVMFFGIMVVYSFGLSWFFTEVFNTQIFIFYRVGMSGFMVLSFIPSVIGIVENVNNRLNNK